MKSRHLLVVALVALACATPASADSSFYYQRTSLTNSIFDALSSAGYWTGNIRAGSGSGTDARQHNNWIPKGHYASLWHDDGYLGSEVPGPGGRASDWRCSIGVRV